MVVLVALHMQESFIIFLVNIKAVDKTKIAHKAY